MAEEEHADVPQPIATEDNNQPGVAPIATSNDPPPTKPLSGISLYLEDNYDELHAEFGTLEEVEFKQEVRKRFKALAKDKRAEYKTRAKAAKETYFDSLEVYLISHPNHEIDDKDKEGLKKHREKMKRRMEEAELEEPPVQKKKKKKRKKKQIREREEEPEMQTEEQFYEDDEQQQESTVQEKFKKAVSGRSKKGFNPEDDERAKQILTSLAKKMKQAAEEDRKLNRRQMPAIEKIKLLKEAVQHLELRYYHKYIIENLEILDVIRDWLSILPDGSMASLNVRKEMYRILENFQLDKYEPDDLREWFRMSSQRTETLIHQDPNKRNFLPFCKTIKMLCTHPKETPENRLRLRNMIMQWCRPLVGNTAASAPVGVEDSQIVQQRNRQLRGRKRYIDGLKSKRARLPQKPWFDFSRNAVKPSELGLQGRSNEIDKRANIERTFRQMHKSKSTRKLASVSLNGKFKFK